MGGLYQGCMIDLAQILIPVQSNQSFSMSHSRPHFFFIFVFQQLIENPCSYKISPLTGYELQTSCVRNDSSAN